MPIFRFLGENHYLMLPGGKRWTNGNKRYVEVEEGVLADVLRGIRKTVAEVDRMPDEVAQRFVAAINDNAEYPMPDFKEKPCVLIGRGASSDLFWERYPAKDYLRVGINPGSTPWRKAGGETGGRVPDETDGRHSEAQEHFDAVMTLDGFYLRECANFPHLYKGPMLGPNSCKENYQGPGSFHDVDQFLDGGAGYSFKFAIKVAFNAGAKDIIFCGCDFQGDALHMRPNIKKFVKKMQDKGARMWRDELSLYKGLTAKVWKPGV